MAEIVFYEKPGCGNNTKQKNLLAEAGHHVLAKNLLTETWTIEKLLAFLKPYPVTDWFNRAAPRVKSGEVNPEAVTAEEALQLILAEPLLLRRPLMQVGDDRRIGFDPEMVAQWIGLTPVETGTDLESCPRQHTHNPCAEP
ncbi:ArsC/Spx/MgsR family protein [Beggiatoa leptomitoformis]|uniref:Nitrogenase-associated protein n=1 Tax=Beggiatoa leptomitoformis TaxID=288004 RepID=A0A2N9YDP9_9GAMM|nr:ArsC/Spx/MgsR family protein [Beggiatoa leptomitoformis]ALG68987.1 hypothetical protein AL038_16440 [Beggiatoa leptomitoformis]AUI68618.1 hypothetical protein BLE401_07805 [Beggiatoa leptomitoformis]